MSLLTEVQDAVTEAGNVAPDIICDYVNYEENVLSLEIDEDSLAKVVDNVWLEDRRWSTVRMAVINRGDENVAYVYHEPSTEMQDWSDWSASDTEVYEVIGKEVTTIQYVRA